MEQCCVDRWAPGFSEKYISPSADNSTSSKLLSRKLKPHKQYLIPNMVFVADSCSSCCHIHLILANQNQNTGFPIRM